MVMFAIPPYYHVKVICNYCCFFQRNALLNYVSSKKDLYYEKCIYQ